jgi:8-oxo-dGTP pyrophosphatase MutT (NUDIX family)
MPGQGPGEPGQGAAAFVFDERGRLRLMRENYGGRRYGTPGGRVEPGEDPLGAVVREAREEVGVEVAVEHLIGIYRLESGFCAYAFRCSITAGVAGDPDGARAEIAEVGWYEPPAIPQPVTNLLHHALADALAGARGVVRDGLRRLT